MKKLFILIALLFLAAPDLFGQGVIKREWRDSLGVDGVHWLVPITTGRYVPVKGIKGLGENFHLTLDSSLFITSTKFLLGRIVRTATIDSINYICVGTSADITPKVYYGPDISATGTATITSPAAVTNVSVGVTRVIGDMNNNLPVVNDYIWFIFTAVTTKPYQFMVTVYYH